MKSQKLHIRFNLPYYTDDPSIRVVWIGHIRVGDDKSHAYPMNHTNVPEEWSVELAIDAQEVAELSYNYRVEKEGEVIRIEPPVPHTVRVRVTGEHHREIVIYDRWIDPSPMHRYRSAPLASILGYSDLMRIQMPAFDSDSGDALLFPYLEPIEGSLAIVGAHHSLGGWVPDKAIPLSMTRNGYLYHFSEPISTEYKLILKLPNGEVVWEEGSNRFYSPNQDGVFTIRYERPPRFALPSSSECNQIRGTAVPLFSLRTAYSYGIGDLSDAIELLDWQKSVEQNILQLLPIYDTTFERNDKDSYPYNAITTYGIHPIYMNVRALSGYREAPERTRWEEQAQELNELEAINYSAVLKLKEEVMDKLFDRWYSTQHTKERGLEKFMAEESLHLLPYALFCTIRDLYPGMPVSQYLPYSEVLEEWNLTKSLLGKSIEKKVIKHAWRQYHLYQQLEKLSFAAAKRNILIKGDLPIGVARDSVDAWVHPELFHLDKEAGSPPDAFSEKGQDWGFPTYNWDAMRTDGFKWWKDRLGHMARYFDAIRVDHILGFFRIWSIPAGRGDASLGHYVPALGYRLEEIRGLQSICNKDDLGLYHPILALEQSEAYQNLDPKLQECAKALRDDYYYQRNEALWRQTAIERLSNILQASDLLICGEDLGVLPQSVQEVLQSQEILSLEVLRMPKKLGRKFVLPNDIPELSVLTTSTHDMPSLRAWWKSLTEDERWEMAKLYRFEEDISPRGLVQALHHTKAILLILPLQDWFVLYDYGTEVNPDDEQINVPEDPNHIWDYRMPGLISDLPRD